MSLDKPLDEEELEALKLTTQEHTIDQIAEQLSVKFSLTARQAKRNKETAIKKLGVAKAPAAVAKALALGILSAEEVASYYGIPNASTNSDTES